METIVLFLLMCSVHAVVSAGQSIRLYNVNDDSNETTTMGYVQVNVSGVWKGISDDGWDAIDAMVACRELGIAEGYAMLYRSNYPPNVPIEGNDFACKGDEESLLSCTYTKVLTRPPYGSRKAAVACGITESMYNEILALLTEDYYYGQKYSIGPLNDAAEGLALYEDPQTVGDYFNPNMHGITLAGGVCDMDDKAAMLICANQGYYFGGKKAKMPTIEGLPMVISKLTCGTHEQHDVGYCDHTFTSTGECPDGIQYNGVSCYSTTPTSVIRVLIFAAVASIFIVIVGACSVHRIRKDRKVSRVNHNILDNVPHDDTTHLDSE